MKKKYSLKELAEMIEPGQLGMQGRDQVLIFRPKDPYDPRVKGFVEATAWQEIMGKDKPLGVFKAYPTLENYNDLSYFGLEFDESQKVKNWRCFSALDLIQRVDWQPGDTLFQYQAEAVKFLINHERAMLSLSPGLGKTLTSAYAAGLREFDNVLVVCPASLLYYWKGELEKWSVYLPRKPFPVVFHRKIEMGLGGGSLLEEREQFWGITNPETAVKYLEQLLGVSYYDCLIIDESIMYKHRESQRSEAIKDLAQAVDVCWLLTGAPATRYLDDMWHQFHILKPQGYRSYWRFARKYCIVEDSEWGAKILANKPDAEKEIKRNFADIYFSRKQDDVADIPDWIMEDLDIPMLPAQDKAYETLRKELYVRLESIDPKSVITVDNHLSLMVRSVQVASNPLLLGGVDSAGKWDALPELMEIYPGPHIVWVNFIETGKLIRDMLSGERYRGRNPKKTDYRVALANGSTKMEDRNEMVDAMQKGELDVLILNNQVGKFGFTLTKARTAFFVERMYDDSYYQCLHRNRRIGTEKSPVIVNMRSVTRTGTRTIDHLIHSTLDYRVGMIKKVTAGDLKKVFKE